MVDVKDMNKIAISLDLAKDVVTKDYLYKLGEYEIGYLFSRNTSRDIR